MATLCKSRTCQLQTMAESRTLVKFGGGKKDETPCTVYKLVLTAHYCTLETTAYWTLLTLLHATLHCTLVHSEHYCTVHTTAYCTLLHTSTQYILLHTYAQLFTLQQQACGLICTIFHIPYMQPIHTTKNCTSAILCITVLCSLLHTTAYCTLLHPGYYYI